MFLFPLFVFFGLDLIFEKAWIFFLDIHVLPLVLLLDPAVQTHPSWQLLGNTARWENMWEVPTMILPHVGLHIFLHKNNP
jgi:hypothetical protein